MSIRKKDGSWQYTIDLGKDPKTGKRKRKSKGGFKTKKDCQNALAKVMTDIDNGVYFEVSGILVADYLYKYLDSVKNNLSVKTYNTYLYITKKHLIPNLGNVAAKDLKPLDIQDFYNDALKKNSPTTVRHFHNLLHRALDQAVKWQVISMNPCDVIEKPRRSKREMLVLNEDQLKILLDRIKGMSIFPFVSVGAMTGMREAEICGLRWENVDVENKILYVKNQLQSVDGALELVPLKTSHSRRSIPLPDYIINLFTEIKNTQEKNKKETFKDSYYDKGFVITIGDGHPYDPAYISRNFNRVLKEYKRTLKNEDGSVEEKTLVEELNIPRIRFHDLRHTHATLLLKAKLSVKVVAERLGDTVDTVMNTYAHVLPDMQREAAEKLNNIFNINVAELAPTE